MRPLLLDDIQKVEYNLLCQFVDYCNAHGLRYYLAGGTLLGAVRHHGFIPWDDDVDTMMPRPDYERFLQLIKDENVFTYCTVSLGVGCLPFVKIFDPRTKIDSQYVTAYGAGEHLWIDLFPIDGLPESDINLSLCFKIQKFLRIMLGISNAKLGKGTSRRRAIIKILIYPFANLISSKRWGLWLDRFSRRLPFDQSKYVGGLVWGYGPQERMLKEEWVKPVKVKFGEREFWAPSNWDTYLTNLYGDYMQLPPAEKRATHHMKVWVEGAEQ